MPHAATNIERIVEYIDAINKESEPLRRGEMSLENANNMIVDAICLQSALTAYVLRHERQREDG